MGVEQGLSGEALSRYERSPRMFHGGEYLGRDLARTKVEDPTLRFIGIMAVFSAISIYAVTTKSFVGNALSLAAVFSFPFVTKRFFYNSRPDVVMNNFNHEGVSEQDI